MSTMEYEGQFDTAHNIEVATQNVTQQVKSQMEGFEEARYLGTMSDDEIDAEYEAGVYAYVFLKREEDPNTMLAIYKVEHQDVGQVILTIPETRTWHPYTNPKEA